MLVRSEGWRGAALGICVSALAIYLVWRFANSLDALQGPGFLLSTLQLGAETVLALFALTASVARLIGGSPIVALSPVDAADAPVTDVFIVVSDPAEIERASFSLAAACRLNYPAECLRVHVVAAGRAADAGLPLARLAQMLNASWIALPMAAHTGTALQMALSRTAGALTLILKPGEAPTPDSLALIASRFSADPRLAMIAMPLMPIDGTGAIAGFNIPRRLPQQSSPISRAILRAGYDAGPQAPAALLWRRAALTSAGGIVRRAIDPQEPARLRALTRGWRAGRAPFPLIATMHPAAIQETVLDTLKQRCARLEAVRLAGSKRLTFGQKAEVLTTLLSTATPFAWLIFLLVPLLAGVMGERLFSGDVLDWAFHGIPALAALAVIPALTISPLRHSAAALAVEAILPFVCLRPFFDFVRTGRFADLDTMPANLGPFLTGFLALALASAGLTGAAGAANEMRFAGELPLFLFALFSAAMALTALGLLGEPKQERHAPRLPSSLEAELVLGGTRHAGMIRDLSVHGARFDCDAVLSLEAAALGALVRIVGPHGPLHFPVQLARVRPAEGRTSFGLVFSERTLIAFTFAVEAVHRSQMRFAALKDQWGTQPSGLSATLQVWLAGVQALVRGLRHARA